jgi:mono/diheme cytochrome c family protein
MHRTIVNICLASAAGFSFLPAALLAVEDQRDLASEARSIFSVKCAGCHGPELSRPNGRFGYVTDLARVAANPEMVVPSFPEESEIWELVRREEMPPENSPSGPLSDDEKELIRAWIAAGAPTTSSSRTSSVPGPALNAGILHRLGPAQRKNEIVSSAQTDLQRFSWRTSVAGRREPASRTCEVIDESLTRPVTFSNIPTQSATNASLRLARISDRSVGGAWHK